MNKTNIFKSSEFYMGVNDVLHMIILEETDIFPDIELVNGDTETVEDATLTAPLANVATEQTASSFVANWEVVLVADGYYLDVATDSAFTSMVAGFDGLDVGDVTSYLVDGLADDTYYYRLRAYKDDEESISSNVIEVAGVSWDFGYLYTKAVVDDIREVTAAGWSLPTEDDFDDLRMGLAPWEFTAIPLMDTDPLYWEDGVGTNVLTFNARGAGVATETGFVQIAHILRLWLKNTGVVQSIDIENNGVIDDGATITDAISIRPVKDSTILTDGQVSIGAYTGNDGKTYDSVCIGGKEWLSRNLAETKFRNSFKVIYGALYNWYAATDVREITAAGWSVPTRSEFDTLVTYLGGALVAGGKLKEIGLIYWSSLGGTNEVNFNARGAGTRVITDGSFGAIRSQSNILLNQDYGSSYGFVLLDSTNTSAVTGASGNYKRGSSVRPFRPATAAEQLLPDGAACDPYIGNDGKVYRTVKIGTQVWLADNLCETKYRNGDSITIVTDNAAWAALVTEAMCYFDNDIDNAFLDTDEIPLALLASSPDFDDPIRLAYDDNEDYV